ncbi:MAG TPA: hypothetical protein VLB10_08985 [Gammaproteobacteria bacterium]|jgi:hypothetical protein|nr:hypothetical protein [Gammaproteobacteria bacterium]
MKKQAFPWIALSLGLLVMVTLLGAGALRPADEHALPLLTMLIVDEFGFFLTLIGAIVGINGLSKESVRFSLLITTLACALLAAGFLLLGLRLWPGGFPAL